MILNYLYSISLMAVWAHVFKIEKKDFIKWGHFRLLPEIYQRILDAKSVQILKREKLNMCKKFFSSSCLRRIVKRTKGFEKQPEELLRHGMKIKREELCFSQIHVSINIYASVLVILILSVHSHIFSSVSCWSLSGKDECQCDWVLRFSHFHRK